MYSFIEILYISWSKGEQKKQYPFHPDELVGEGTKGRCLMLNCIAGHFNWSRYVYGQILWRPGRRRLGIPPKGSQTYGNSPKTESFQVLGIVVIFEGSGWNPWLDGRNPAYILICEFTKYVMIYFQFYI